MKVRFFFILAAPLCFVACTDQQLQTLQDVADTVLETEGSTAGLSQDEVVAGLREALVKGTEKGVELAAVKDGFFKNEQLFIPFPEEAAKVKEKALQLGLDGQVNQFEETLNRAAEEAVKSAIPVFGDAIREMTIQDGFAILKGADNAATAYLKEKTTNRLTETFRPKVEAAIAKVELTKYWSPLADSYNLATQFTGGEPINPDLTAYVTERAVSGLFVHIAAEEKNIRENPQARVTALLQKVFGSVTGG